VKKFGKLRERISIMYGRMDDFAKVFGVNSATLSKKLTGKSQITKEDIEKFCELLDIPVEQIPEYFFYDFGCQMATAAIGAGC
jgi:transcriptional regulator with XRE-family HTH domain